MNYSRKLLTIIAVVLAGYGWAQQTAVTDSMKCNEDGTVTFRYKNDNAKQVFVDVQFAGRKEMTRDAQTGVWSSLRTQPGLLSGRTRSLQPDYRPEQRRNPATARDEMGRYDAQVGDNRL